MVLYMKIFGLNYWKWYFNLNVNYFIYADIFCEYFET